MSTNSHNSKRISKATTGIIRLHVRSREAYSKLNLQVRSREAYSKLNLQERGLIQEGGLPERGNFQTSTPLLEDRLVVLGKYLAKGPKKPLEVPKNELDKMAI